jgi:hypothetical protein
LSFRDIFEDVILRVVVNSNLIGALFSLADWEGSSGSIAKESSSRDNQKDANGKGNASSKVQS